MFGEVDNATDAPVRRMLDDLNETDALQIGQTLPDCFEVGIKRPERISQNCIL
jgi:hypothetical protein